MLSFNVNYGMGKILCILIAVVALFVPRSVFAQSEFLVNSEVSYQILDGNRAKVVHQISIANTSTESHATDYTLNIRGSDVSDVSSYDEVGDHEVIVTEEGGATSIKTIFADSVVGEGNIRKFTIEYSDSSVVNKNGDVVEINIPRLANEAQFESYLVSLKVPSSMGAPAYISPDPDNVVSLGDTNTYLFEKTALNKAGVTAAFGQYQVFSFDLSYHLQNPLALPSHIEVALPPDTSFQKIVFQSLTPPPNEVHQDIDGNWIATYKLGARERLDVRAIGTAQIFASPWKSTTLKDSERSRYLSDSVYWQVDSEEIKSIAAELKTAREIYDYVVNTLDYNYDRVFQGSERLGALGAIGSPANAICTEFSDLFIALARASGIPAREVNGYAHTENKTLQPLSLVADVLHAWPEYWDEDKKVWVPVDPTWGDTSGGIDYFDKLDMKHFSFVMHGGDPTSPIPPGSYKLGANPQKDVFISLGELAPAAIVKPEITLSQKNTLPFQGVKLSVDILNKSGTALYDKKVELYFDGKKQFERDVDALLPYEKRVMEFAVPYGVLGKNIPDEVLLVFGGGEYRYKPDKTPALVRDIAFSSFLTITLVVGAFLVIRRVR